MNMSSVDYVVALTDVIILVLAEVVGVMFVANKMNGEHIKVNETVVESVDGTKVKGDTVHDRIQSYQREQSARQSERATQQINRGAR